MSDILPTALELIGSEVTEQEFKIALTNLLNYLNSPAYTGGGDQWFSLNMGITIQELPPHKHYFSISNSQIKFLLNSYVGARGIACDSEGTPLLITVVTSPNKLPEDINLHFPHTHDVVLGYNHIDGLFYAKATSDITQIYGYFPITQPSTVEVHQHTFKQSPFAEGWEKVNLVASDFHISSQYPLASLNTIYYPDGRPPVSVVSLPYVEDGQMMAFSQIEILPRWIQQNSTIEVFASAAVLFIDDINNPAVGTTTEFWVDLFVLDSYKSYSSASGVGANYGFPVVTNKIWQMTLNNGNNEQRATTILIPNTDTNTKIASVVISRPCHYTTDIHLTMHVVSIELYFRKKSVNDSELAPILPVGDGVRY